MKTTILTIIILCLLVIPLETRAYFEKTSGGSLVSTITPKDPGPNENIRISLTGYGYNIDESQIVWIIDGQKMQDGFGKKSYLLKTPDLGQELTVSILVLTKTGRTITKKIVFQPSDVDLIWEANTYTPSFYRGAKLASPGSTVTVTAVPHIIENDNFIAPENLIYTWRKNYHNLVNESGIGKNFITFPIGSLTSVNTIEVTVTSPSSTDKAYKKISIATTQPKMVIYPYEPLFGSNYAQSINKIYQLTNKEQAYKAEPYYLNEKNIKSGSYIFLWRINGKEVKPAINNPNILNITRDITSTGTATIESFVFDLNSRLSQAKTEFKVIFDNSIF